MFYNWDFLEAISRLLGSLSACPCACLCRRHIDDVNGRPHRAWLYDTSPTEGPARPYDYWLCVMMTSERNRCPLTGALGGPRWICRIQSRTQCRRSYLGAGKMLRPQQKKITIEQNSGTLNLQQTGLMIAQLSGFMASNHRRIRGQGTPVELEYSVNLLRLWNLDSTVTRIMCIRKTLEITIFRRKKLKNFRYRPYPL